MNKQIKLWYLYDFANSFATIVLIFYYPLMLAEKGASNVWIGVSASVATLLMLIMFPYLGAYSDRIGKRIYFIRGASLLMVLSLVALAFILDSREALSTSALLLLSVLYVVFQFSFQGSYVFYSAMLKNITEGGHDNAKVSGVGLGFGQLGNAVALGVIGPIIATPFLIIGLSGKPLALFIGAVTFTLLALPFLFQKEDSLVSKEDVFSYKRFIKKVFLNKKVFFFLIGYSLLADAILTFQLYLTLYMNKVFGFSDQMVTYVGITGLLFAVLGGFFASKASAYFKSKERTLHIATLLYAGCFVLLALIPKVTAIIFITLAMSGVAYGLLFALARAVYSDISPREQQAEFFSFFTIFEKAASVIGPLVWLLTFYALVRFGEDIQYRGSVLFLMIICLGGFYFLRKSKSIQASETNHNNHKLR